MLRRQFISGLLCAPALVRASSLDALPRGAPLLGGHWDAVQLGVGQFIITFSDPVRPYGVYQMRNGVWRVL